MLRADVEGAHTKLREVVRKREEQRQVLRDQLETARQQHIVLSSKILGLAKQVNVRVGVRVSGWFRVRLGVRVRGSVNKAARQQRIVFSSKILGLVKQVSSIGLELGSELEL